MSISHSQLLHYHKTYKESFPASLDLRTYRAIRWLARSEQEKADPDAGFMFLWVAFNAAYAQELGHVSNLTESEQFKEFLGKICKLDKDGRLYDLVWTTYSDSIRILLSNQYVFQPFWDYHNGNLSEADWTRKFRGFRSGAQTALKQRDTKSLLGRIFSSLYTLRNQLVHGGATWNSSRNREQVKSGEQILRQIVPVIIDIMMHNPNQLWGDACYPVID